MGEIGFLTYFPAAVHTVYGNSFPGRRIPHSQLHRCPDKKNSLTTSPPCGKGVFMHGDEKEKTSPRSDLTSFRSSFSRFTKTCTPFATPRTPAGPVAWTRTTPNGVKKKACTVFSISLAQKQRGRLFHELDKHTGTLAFYKPVSRHRNGVKTLRVYGLDETKSVCSGLFCSVVAPFLCTWRQVLQNFARVFLFSPDLTAHSNNLHSDLLPGSLTSFITPLLLTWQRSLLIQITAVASVWQRPAKAYL